MWYILTLFCLLVVQQVISEEPNEAKDEMTAQEANIEDFPYQVSFLDDGGRLCSGLIVSKQFLLTSGDCGIHFNNSNPIVMAGSSDYNNGTAIPIANVTVHPKYQTTNIITDYDIACMQTTDPIDFSDTIRDIKIAKKKSREVTGNVTISGWNLLEKNTATLMFIVEEPLPNGHCEEVWRDLYNDHVFCVGSDDDNDHNEEICQDNSGAPAVQDGAAVGLFSFGGKCGTPSASMVFTDFLNTQMRNYIRDCTEGTAAI